MASIIKCKVRNQTYLYESESYRDDSGKVKNRRRIVGKVDPATGQHVFKPEYIEEKGLGALGESAQEARIYTANDVKQSVVKEYGAFHLLGGIVEQIGLSSVLSKAMPNSWKSVLSLAFYMVASGEPALYCEDWLYKTESYEGVALSSQRISELLTGITADERMNFFEYWGKQRMESEYLALDITSISTYSELMNEAEWGYNRDKEKLPQVNVCLLVGEKSQLPIIQTVYSGSLKDVSTLKSTLQVADSLSFTNMALVMDKGFASTKNINAMLDKEAALRFLIALPFSMGFAKRQIIGEERNIDCVDNTIAIGNDVLRGIMKQRAWNPENSVFVHVYFNPDNALNARNKLYAKVKKLVKRTNQNPEKYQSDELATKYLSIRKSGKNEMGYTVNIKHDVLSDELATTGFLVLISNHVDCPEKAIQIYRSKDVVEKGFQRMKNCLDLARLRVHSDEAMQNKIFVGFIALIITAHIHKVMTDHQLYDTYTMKKLIKTLERLKIHHIKSDRIASPLTKEHKTIFDAFHIKHDL